MRISLIKIPTEVQEKLKKRSSCPHPPHVMPLTWTETKWRRVDTESRETTFKDQLTSIGRRIS